MVGVGTVTINACTACGAAIRMCESRGLQIYLKNYETVLVKVNYDRFYCGYTVWVRLFVLQHRVV